MSEHVAYEFKSDLSLGEIFSKLQQVGPWEWSQRDNDRWDEYISASPTEEPIDIGVKIFVEDRGLYVADILFRYRQEDQAARAQYEGVKRTLFERLLPAIGARELTKADPRE